MARCPQASWGGLKSFVVVMSISLLLLLIAVVPITSSETRIDGYPCYRDVQGIYDFMDTLSGQYSSLVQKKKIGVSYQKSVGQGGYNINALKITAPATRASSMSKGKLFILAGLHAREYAPPELLLRFASHLVDNYNVDAEITMILEQTEIHMVPLANPDGRKYCEENPRHSQRKNMHLDNRVKCSDGDGGVDLNRNFPFKWGMDTGSVDDPCGSDFRGYGPASEPEIQAIINYASNLFPVGQRKRDPDEENLYDPYSQQNTGLFFDIHSYGGVNFWPWAFVEEKPPNDVQLRTLSMKFASFNGYAPTGAGGVNWWYPSSGSAEDWAYGHLGVASTLFEVGTDFYEQCNYFEKNILEQMIPTLLYGAKMALKPFKTPLGPDIMKVARPMKRSHHNPVIAQNTSFMLRVCASDEARIRNNDENYVETGQQDVIGVDLYIDNYPGANNAANRLIMVPADGKFNSKSEIAEYVIDLSFYSVGQHIVYFQAIDAHGFKGAVTARYFSVCDPSSPECVDASEETDTISSC